MPSRSARIRAGLNPAPSSSRSRAAASAEGPAWAGANPRRPARPSGAVRMTRTRPLGRTAPEAVRTIGSGVRQRPPEGGHFHPRRRHRNSRLRAPRPGLRPRGPRRARPPPPRPPRGAGPRPACPRPRRPFPRDQPCRRASRRALAIQVRPGEPVHQAADRPCPWPAQSAPSCDASETVRPSSSPVRRSQKSEARRANLRLSAAFRLASCFLLLASAPRP